MKGLMKLVTSSSSGGGRDKDATAKKPRKKSSLPPSAATNNTGPSPVLSFVEPRRLRPKRRGSTGSIPHVVLDNAQERSNRGAAVLEDLPSPSEQELEVKFKQQQQLQPFKRHSVAITPTAKKSTTDSNKKKSKDTLFVPESRQSKRGKKHKRRGSTGSISQQNLQIFQPQEPQQPQATTAEPRKSSKRHSVATTPTATAGKENPASKSHKRSTGKTTPPPTMPSSTKKDEKSKLAAAQHYNNSLSHMEAIDISAMAQKQSRKNHMEKLYQSVSGLTTTNLEQGMLDPLPSLSQGSKMEKPAASTPPNSNRDNQIDDSRTDAPPKQPNGGSWTTIQNVLALANVPQKEDTNTMTDPIISPPAIARELKTKAAAVEETATATTTAASPPSAAAAKEGKSHGARRAKSRQGVPRVRSRSLTDMKRTTTRGDTRSSQIVAATSTAVDSLVDTTATATSATTDQNNQEHHVHNAFDDWVQQSHDAAERIHTKQLDMQERKSQQQQQRAKERQISREQAHQAKQQQNYEDEKDEQQLQAIKQEKKKKKKEKKKKKKEAADGSIGEQVQEDKPQAVTVAKALEVEAELAREKLAMEAHLNALFHHDMDKLQAQAAKMIAAESMLHQPVPANEAGEQQSSRGQGRRGIGRVRSRSLTDMKRGKTTTNNDKYNNGDPGIFDFDFQNDSDDEDNDPMRKIDHKEEKAKVKEVKAKCKDLYRQLEAIQQAERDEVEEVLQSYKKIFKDIKKTRKTIAGAPSVTDKDLVAMDEAVAQSKEIVSYLRHENERRRVENRKLKESLFDLHQATVQLEKAAEATLEYYQELEALHASEKEKNDALQHNLNICKRSKDELEDRRARRDAYLEYELNTRRRYENRISAIVARFHDQGYPDKAFVQELWDMAGLSTERSGKENG